MQLENGKWDVIQRRGSEQMWEYMAGKWRVGWGTHLLSNERWILLNGRNQAAELSEIKWPDIWRSTDRQLRVVEREMLIRTETWQQISGIHHLSNQMKAQYKINILGSIMWGDLWEPRGSKERCLVMAAGTETRVQKSWSAVVFRQELVGRRQP